MKDLTIDPNQYDHISWETEGAVDSPSRKFFRFFLEKELGDVQGKSILDVGSGVGQLFPMLKSLGAAKIVGIEPSEKNLLASRELFPDVEVVKETFESFGSQEKFDLIIFLLSLEHIPNLDLVFSKSKSLLNEDGKILLITLDKKYKETPRYGYKLDIENIDEDVSLVSADRNGEKMVSIVRSVRFFEKTADKNGFALEKIIEIKPTESFISEVPKYGEFRDTTISHLMKFKLK
jgi:SAM-dependent methyltransferase